MSDLQTSLNTSGSFSDETISHFRQEFYKTLSAPLDDLWDLTIHGANIELISSGSEQIGYFAIDEDKNILHFFISRNSHKEARNILQNIIKTRKLKTGLLQTQNALFLQLGMALGKELSVHSYIFEENPQVPFKAPSPWPRAKLNQASMEEADEVVVFCHHSIGNPISWIEPYTFDQIEKGNVYVLREGKEILGICEVRHSESQPVYSNLGMIVGKEHRNQGLGSYLLRRARSLAHQKGWIPICSCEKNNKASRIAIKRAGFRQKSMVLKVEF